MGLLYLNFTHIKYYSFVAIWFGVKWLESYKLRSNDAVAHDEREVINHTYSGCAFAKNGERHTFISLKSWDKVYCFHIMSSGTTINKIFIAERDDFHRDGAKGDLAPRHPFAPNSRTNCAQQGAAEQKSSLISMARILRQHCYPKTLYVHREQ